MRRLETKAQIDSSGNTSEKECSSKMEFPCNALQEIQMTKSR
jgi:hypothetical protein